MTVINEAGLYSLILRSRKLDDDGVHTLPLIDSLAELDEDERDVHTVNTSSGNQEMTVINEAGLYSLILLQNWMKMKFVKPTPILLVFNPADVIL